MIEHNSSLDDQWQIPEFEEITLSPQSHKTALVIPVLNEGERIQRQLHSINEFDHQVDIIIADGGSTDGAVDPQFLSETNVRAKLTKIGPGKLSAQLRMAYAWALKQGYESIITVDGNNKDGMGAIKLFLQKLAEGYDYVQGSRYHFDGMHENTPLERTFANRMIHAPLLSLASGTKLTDTTNGYRAYSANYLLDPRVQPFRNEFERYELLFYLSVRAGRLGLNVTEVPVTRRYPKSGGVPTKINGVVGKLDILRQTFSAALGLYNPKSSL